MAKEVLETAPSSPFKFPADRSQPLQTLSPERVNGTRQISATSTTTSQKSFQSSEPESHDVFESPTKKTKASLFADYDPNRKVKTEFSGFGLPQSPSLPEIHALRSHVRTNSDVQGLVKRFEHLDVRDRDAESIERRKRHEAELSRAQIAREEAESDVRRLREEMRRLKRESEEGRERERKVGKRLEVLQEELGTAKEAQSSGSSVYEKELRKARKEAFKSSSAVLKLQEELKSTRNALRATQSGFDVEKQKVARKEQERFEMEYQLIPLQEQVEKLKNRIRIAEEEKEALKTSLKEEEVARVAAQGKIALPVSQDMDLDLMNSSRKVTSPQKRSNTASDEDKENMPTLSKKLSESMRLAEELAREKMRRENAEELVDFLRMECMFRCCGCSTATTLSHDFGLELDAELAAGVERIRASMEKILTPTEEKDEMEIEVAHAAKTEVEGDVVEIKMEVDSAGWIEAAPEKSSLPEDFDRSQTFATAAESPTPTRSLNDQTNEEEEPADQASPQAAAHEPSPMREKTTTVPTQLSTPSPTKLHQTTPFHQQPSIRTVTTTTSIPMHFTPITKPTFAPFFDTEDAENIPPTPSSAAGSFDRAAALAAIEYRRGRAKSIANGHATPRKQMLEGVKERRDISAPALGQKVPGVAPCPVKGGSVRGSTK